MAHISFEELPDIRKKHEGEKIVFCSGKFDIIHGGHVLFFEECRKYGDLLVVMLASDAVMQRFKGNGRPIINQHARIKLLEALKPVDYCLIDETTSTDVHPLKPIENVFQKLKPDVYVINEDAFDIPYRKELSEKYHVRLVVLKREAPPEFQGISTTKIVEKLKASGENNKA